MGFEHLYSDRHSENRSLHADSVMHPPVKTLVISGMKAGIIGGVAMAITLTFSYDAQGSSLLLPIRVFVAHLFGSIGLASSDFGVFVGILIHLVFAAGFGAFFGFLMATFVGKVDTLTAVFVGSIYGLLVWIVSQFVILEYITPNALMLYNQSILALSHVVYGVCLGLFGSAYRLLPRTNSICLTR